MKRIRAAFPCLIILCAQGALLFHNLDLLAMWGDELFTFHTIQKPFPEIAAILERDIHPPLYYFLLHEWVRLPLPWSGAAAVRSFSAAIALICTLLLDLLWLHRWKPVRRWLGLSLFAFSPCLLLYGRMARSYTLQTALVMTTVYLLWRWMRKPRDLWTHALPAFCAAGLLLYTHYLPGLAVLGGFAVAGWKRIGATRMVAFGAAAALAYAPWLVTLAGALRSWGQATGFQSHYTLSANRALEQVIKICFGFTSLLIGESFLPPALLLVPLALWVIWRACRVRSIGPSLLPMILLAAVIGYVGADRWVTWPFIAARLLWLLPFFTLALTAGLTNRRNRTRQVVAAALLISAASSTVLYFRIQNFMNHGYAAPFREIAAALKQAGSPRDVVLMDAYNTDTGALGYYLGNQLPWLSMRASAREEARTAAARAHTVWIVRTSRDVSPGRVVSQIADEACRNRIRSDRFYEPITSWQRSAIRLAAGGPVPEYFYQVIACKQGGAAAPAR